MRELAERTQRMPLRAAPACQAWVLPNSGSNGYLLSRVPA
jgi:hypothetical protein